MFRGTKLFEKSFRYKNTKARNNWCEIFWCFCVLVAYPGESGTKIKHEKMVCEKVNDFPFN